MFMSETQIGTQLSNEKNLIKDMKKIYKKANRIYRGIKRIQKLKTYKLVFIWMLHVQCSPLVNS